MVVLTATRRCEAQSQKALGISLPFQLKHLGTNSQQ